MREKILNYIEKNSRIDVHELAIILGVPSRMTMSIRKKLFSIFPRILSVARRFREAQVSILKTLLFSMPTIL